mgnify:CR=1 FL=1
MSKIELAVIGGSGLYQMDALTDVEELNITTPFGMPSDAIMVGTLNGRRIAFLPRHGREHHLNPNEVPYRANIFALKTLGVRYIMSVSACGSLQEEYAPGHIVVPDQLFDHTKGRNSSFFGNGLVVHASVANPFSPEMSQIIAQSCRAAGGTVHEGGTFITIEGPRFSTKAESMLFRQWGMSIIGMTTSPEAFLALEAEIAYGVMAHVTDYDVWHESEEPVTVEMVLRTMRHNTMIAQKTLTHLVKTIDEWAGDFPAHQALKNAIITHPQYIPAERKQELAVLVGKYLA